MQKVEIGHILVMLLVISCFILIDHLFYFVFLLLFGYVKDNGGGAALCGVRHLFL